MKKEKSKSKMRLKEIIHGNAVNWDKGDLKIYCRKNHKIMVPQESDCTKCDFYYGSMQGNGLECIWEDYTDSDSPMVFIKSSEKEKELLRVSKLIDKKILKKITTK